MNILQKIFTDHYEEIKYTLHPRKTEMENIDKMINCGDPSFGGAMYSCPHCGYLKYVSFHCHTRFCPSCGTKYSLEITTCGALLNWSRNTLFKNEWNYCQENQLNFWDYMDKRIFRSSTGVIILPQFGSPGTPDINYQVTGTITGLTLHTTVDELSLALKEALAFQMKLAYEHAACTEELYPDIKTCIGVVVKYTAPVLPDEEKSEIFEKKYTAYKRLYEKCI